MNALGHAIGLTVNGQPVSAQVHLATRLSAVLRDSLGLTGTKVGCDAGDCGACTVLLDGEAVCACLVPAASAQGRSVRTVEGLGGDTLSALQAAFLSHGAAQCGICTPGMLMAATALLRDNPAPSRAEAEYALGGVLCRCTGYTKILDAICDAGQPYAKPDLPDAGQAVGARIERLDGVPKVLGTEIFGADHIAADALEVRAIRSPHHAATFAIGDTANWAAQASGPIHVFTAADIPGIEREVGRAHFIQYCCKLNEKCFAQLRQISEDRGTIETSCSMIMDLSGLGTRHFRGSKRVQNGLYVEGSPYLSRVLQVPILSFRSSSRWDRGDHLSSRSRTMNAFSDTIDRSKTQSWKEHQSTLLRPRHAHGP